MTETDPTCTLTDEVLENRSLKIRSRLGSKFEGTEEIENGYIFSFHGEEGVLGEIASFVEDELHCCSFAEYSVSVSPPYDRIRLMISGPNGTKGVFEPLLDILDGEKYSTTRDQEATGQRTTIRDHYGDLAARSSTCCSGTDVNDDAQARRMGYSASDITGVAEGANLGLGCGNPTGIASLSTGETVLDLGSGAGFDCFLASKVVGPEGHIVGVDMTPEMIQKARENIEKNDTSNVEFRLGEIEQLPINDASIDVILSNCVVNLSPEKDRVFSEAFRVLKPGGRLAISDIVVTAPLPPEIRKDPSSVAGCIAGGSTIDELESIIKEVGFEAISIEPKSNSESIIREWDADRDLSEYIVSIEIQARKPS